MQNHRSAPYRRIVTGHNQVGRAIIRSDEIQQPELIPSGVAAFSLVWTTGQLPADNNDPIDGRERDAGLTLRSGSVIRVVDMLPGASSPMHRSNSIDYGIVVAGEIELELDDGVRTVAGPGSVIVQRGTLHRWTNPSADVPCRIVFVLIEATPVRINGQPLPEIHP